MSRDLTWAATSVPEIRGRWCNALDAMADGQAEMIASPPEGGAAAGVAKRIERMQEKATAALEVMRSEAAALRGAELYWVARSHGRCGGRRGRNAAGVDPSAGDAQPHRDAVLG